MNLRTENGVFVTVEGPEFSGKTTAIQTFNEKYMNDNVVVTREPGGTEKGKILREWVTNPEGPFTHNQNLSAMGFAMDRAIHIHDVILPALQEGKNVISDRYIDSSYVLQGIIRGFGIDKISKINALANSVDNVSAIFPSATIFFDVSEEMALERFKQRGNANLMDIEFMKKFKEIREGYLYLASLYPERYIIIDANGSMEKTFELFEKAVLSVFHKENDSVDDSPTSEREGVVVFSRKASYQKPDFVLRMEEQNNKKQEY